MSTATIGSAPVADRAAAPGVEVRSGGEWTPVCALDRLGAGRGVAALLPDGRQVAVFRDHGDRLYAVANQDPFTGACVLSRGLLGSTADGRVYVASPLLKQRFDLAGGECLDDPEVRIEVFAVRAV